jgi:hypothetical protein
MVIRGWYLSIILCILLNPFVIGEKPENSSSFITLERGMCFGYCPVYSLTIFENGSVIYDGREFVKETGIRSATVNTTLFEDLMNLAEETGFPGMNDTYSAYVITDMPSATIIMKNGTTIKRVEHYQGDESAPENLTRFEEAIDLAGNVTQWTTPFEPESGDSRMI